MNDEQPLETKFKKIEHDNIIYLLNTKEKTAAVFDHNENLSEIFIPRSFNHESQEYDVLYILDDVFDSVKIEFVQFASDSNLQVIGKHAFDYSSIKYIKIPSSVIMLDEGAFCNCELLKTIEIPEDSKLQTICENAFSDSNIQSITIPSELINLEEGWCNFTPHLTKITVSPKNPRYCCYEHKMIIGKTNIEQKNYDCLVFCVRDVQQIKIPNFIERICSYSFDNCDLLEMIEIPEDSKLQTICKNAFSDSNIQSITIPSELINLEEGWCDHTQYLTKITVSPKNPRYCCYEHKMIIGKTNIEQNNYDCLVFCVRDVQRIKIPNFIERICSYSFENCEKLDVIEIPEDSKLQTICECAFFYSNIQSITIPSSVTSIGINAFICCDQLSISEALNSDLISMYKEAFQMCKNALLMVPVRS